MNSRWIGRVRSCLPGVRNRRFSKPALGSQNQRAKLKSKSNTEKKERGYSQKEPQYLREPGTTSKSRELIVGDNSWVRSHFLKGAGLALKEPGVGHRGKTDTLGRRRRESAHLRRNVRSSYNKKFLVYQKKVWKIQKFRISNEGWFLKIFNHIIYLKYDWSKIAHHPRIEPRFRGKNFQKESLIHLLGSFF